MVAEQQEFTVFLSIVWFSALFFLATFFNSEKLWVKQEFKLFSSLKIFLDEVSLCWNSKSTGME